MWPYEIAIYTDMSLCWLCLVNYIIEILWVLFDVIYRRPSCSKQYCPMASTIFPLHLVCCSLNIRYSDCVADVSTELGHPIVNWSLHIDQLWPFVIFFQLLQKGTSLKKGKGTLICVYRYLECVYRYLECSYKFTLDQESGSGRFFSRSHILTVMGDWLTLQYQAWFSSYW